MPMATARQRKLKHARRVTASRPRTGPCLYCRGTDGPWRSREHIVPESLGNATGILVPGVVCDPCNNRALSQADRDLVTFQPIEALRTMLHIPGKKGKLATARFTNAHLIARPGSNLLIDCQGGKPAMVGSNGSYKLNLTGKRTKVVDIQGVTRSLYKMLVGFAWMDDRRLAMSPRLDTARSIVLERNPFNGYLVMTKSCNPKAESRFTYQYLETDRGATVAIHADILGLHFFTDLDIRRIKHPNDIPRDEFEVYEF